VDKNIQKVNFYRSISSKITMLFDSVPLKPPGFGSFLKTLGFVPILSISNTEFWIHRFLILFLKKLLKKNYGTGIFN
jgi:hypothetical protein